jgi:hypothetical protein
MVQKNIFRILLEPKAMKSVKQNYLTCVSLCVCVCVCERESARE